MILLKTLRLLKNKNTNNRLKFLINKKEDLINMNKTDNNKLNSMGIINDKHELYTKNSIKKDLINYLIKFNLTLTNTFVDVTDVKGNLKLSISAGKIDLKKRQKVQQPNSLIQILKHLFLKAKFLQNKAVGLQFKNTKTYHELMIINNLKNKIFIKSLRSYNLYPHNGCRPKKIKRFKRRTKRLRK